MRFHPRSLRSPSTLLYDSCGQPSHVLPESPYRKLTYSTSSMVYPAASLPEEAYKRNATIIEVRPSPCFEYSTRDSDPLRSPPVYLLS